MTHGVAKSAESWVSSSRIAVGPPVDAPITTTPGESGEAFTRAVVRGGVAGATVGAATAGAVRRAGCAAAAALTFEMISRRSDARLTGAVGEYFRMKSTAPSSSALSV